MNLITTVVSRRVRPLLATLLLLASAAAHPQDRLPAAEVIVSPALKSITLDRSLLRAVFTMRVRQWPDGSPVRVFVLPDDDPLSDLFYRERLGMYSYVLRRAWDRMVFTGTGLAPTVVQSEEQMKELVRSTPGAIGYVRTRGPSGYRYERPRSIIALLTKDAND